jgi:REP element-mobilizing transposase RayT
VWNASEIGRSLGEAHTTVRRHADILTGALVVRQLQPWFANIGKREVKSPKLYVRDTGLLHTLLGITGFESLESNPRLGASWDGGSWGGAVCTLAIPSSYHFSSFLLQLWSYENAGGGLMFSQPIASLLTWTTYGTWLPGDRRGWVRRGAGMQPPDDRAERGARRLMTETPCILDLAQRRAVEEAIYSHCILRGWRLHAVNCRTNHVHVVVTASSVRAAMARRQLKAWCTRRLKQMETRSASEGNPARPMETRSASEGNPFSVPAAAVRRNWWAERGSERPLFDEEGLHDAIQYVLEGQ